MTYLRISRAMLSRTACYSLALAAAAYPASAFASDDAQLWLTEVAAVRIDDNWRFSEEVITRISDARHGLYEVESNSLIGYRIAPRITVWAGYTHDPTYNAGHFAAMEHRAREQISADDVRLGRLVVALRMRAEQRWHEGMAGTGWRLRPFVRVALPFRAGGATGIAVSHESFVNLNHTPFQAIGGEDRMRNAIALYAPVTKGLNVEFGYLDQYRFVPGGVDGRDHAVTASLNAAFR